MIVSTWMLVAGHWATIAIKMETGSAITYTPTILSIVECFMPPKPRGRDINFYGCLSKTTSSIAASRRCHHRYRNRYRTVNHNLPKNFGHRNS